VVPIDTMIFVNAPFGNKQEPEIFFTDPTGGEHYYRFLESINDSSFKNINAFSDQYHNGYYLSRKLGTGSHTLVSGDVVSVSLECIDQNVYNYFRTLALIANGGGLQVSPANPLSNIDNNALGYFSAYTTTTKTLVYP
jgi:hypothetical protein